MKRKRLRMLLLGVVAVVAVAIGLVTYGETMFSSVELSTVDTRFSVRGTEKPPSDLVVVGVDDKTLSDLHVRWPYPRGLHAKVIDRLKADGAKVIAYDVEFADRSRERQKPCAYFGGAPLPPNDCALATAAAKAKNLVFSFTAVGAKGNTNFIGANGNRVLPALHARPGFTGIADDSDGSNRRFKYGEAGLKSFAVVAAERGTGRKVSRSIFRDDGTAWIDFYGPPGTIPEVAFSDVINGKTPPGYFRGKTDAVLSRVFEYWRNVDPDLGKKVEEGVHAKSGG